MVKKTVYCLFVITTLCVCMFSWNNVYASDEPVDFDLFANEDVQTYEFSKNSVLTGTGLDGAMFVLPDNESNTFSVCLKMNETTLTSDNNNIILYLCVLENDCKYDVYVNQQGIMNDDTVGDFVSANAVYLYEDDYHSFMAVVKFKNKNISRNIDVCVIINGTKYLITDNQTINTFVIENEPSTNSSNTKRITASTTIKSTQKATSKFADKTTKATTTATTKYTPDNTSVLSQTQPYASTENTTQLVTDTNSTGRAQEMAASSKIMTSAGVAVSFMGITFVAIGAIKHAKIKSHKS